MRRYWTDSGSSRYISQLKKYRISPARNTHKLTVDFDLSLHRCDKGDETPVRSIEPDARAMFRIPYQLAKRKSIRFCQ